MDYTGYIIIYLVAIVGIFLIFIIKRFGLLKRKPKIEKQVQPEILPQTNYYYPLMENLKQEPVKETPTIAGNVQKPNIQPKNDSLALTGSSVHSSIHKLNMDKLNVEFKQFDDDYYDKAQKITNYEIGHAHVVHNKQLDIHLAKENRAKLVSGG